MLHFSGLSIALVLALILPMTSSLHAVHANSTTLDCRRHEIPIYSTFVRASLGVILVIFVIVSTASNGFILALLLVQNKSRTVVNAFIASQCLTDLALTVIIMPITLYAICVSDRDPMSRILCRTQYYFSRMFGFVTVFNLMAISLDRYVVIIKPNMKVRISPRATLISIVSMWIFVAVGNVPWELIASGRFNAVCLTSRHYYCIISTQGLGQAELIYTVARIVVFVIIPFLIMFYCFYKIFKAVRIGRRQIGPTITGDWRKIAVKVYSRSAVTTILVIGSFMVCTLPFLLVTFVLMRHANVSPGVALTFKWLAWSDTAIKPLIYLIRSRKYSLKFKQFLLRRMRFHPKVSRESIKKYGTPTGKDLAARMSSYAVEVTSPVHYPTEREFTRLFTVQRSRTVSTTAWDADVKF